MILSNVFSGDRLGGRGTSRLPRQPHSRPRWLADLSARSESAGEKGWREKLFGYRPAPSDSLLAASTAVALSWAGSLLMLPGLQLISIPITLVVALPIAYDAVDAIREQEAKGATISIVGVAGALILHQPTGAALIEVAHFTLQSFSNWRENHWNGSAAERVPADTDVYIVHYWSEDEEGEQSTIRYVLESPDSSSRQGFARLSDLMNALRGALGASPQA